MGWFQLYHLRYLCQRVFILYSSIAFFFQLIRNFALINFVSSISFFLCYSFSFIVVAYPEITAYILNLLMSTICYYFCLILNDAKTLRRDWFGWPCPTLLHCCIFYFFICDKPHKHFNSSCFLSYFHLHSFYAVNSFLHFHGFTRSLFQAKEFPLELLTVKVCW